MPKPARTAFAKTRTLAPAVAKARRSGRRPTGPGGAKVSEYPHVMIRLPQATKDTLDALSGITGVPVWQLVDHAIHAFVRALPVVEQKLIADVRSRRARTES
jgi:hypothetical protein